MEVQGILPPPSIDHKEIYFVTLNLAQLPPPYMNVERKKVY